MMVEKLKLILADDEEFICVMLTKLIRFDALGIELAGIAHDGEELLRMIEEKRPEIVVTDISMPKMDGLEVIRNVLEKGIPCRFVMISGYRQFEYAYNALKYNVEDYLLKPVEQEELNRVLEKIAQELCRSNKGPTPQSRDDGLQAYFLERAVHQELKRQDITLDVLNETYHLALRRGCYRIAFLRLDHCIRKKAEEDISSVIGKMRQLAEETLRGHCFEIIYARKPNGLYLACNYAPEKERQLTSAFRELFNRAHQIADMFRDLHLTLCVGKTVDRVDRLEEAKDSCRRAIWLRMNYGMDRVIFEEEYPPPQMDSFRRPMDEIGGALDRAVTALDRAEMCRQLDALFTLPAVVLCSLDTMKFIRWCIERFDKRCAYISGFEIEEGMVARQILDALHQWNTFPEYRDEMKAQFTRFMEQSMENAQKKTVKPIRQAYAYIDDHYSEHITLESVAAHINLNPVYFSNLFKKETGKNFVEYLTEYRIEMAKKLLRNGKMNINELADHLGYSDARYFSKLFKKEVGLKPTEYRKIYG